MLRLLLLLIFTLPCTARADIPACLSSVAEQQICSINDLHLIHPTQFNYGQNYVKAKVASFLKNSPADNQKYLAIRGPLNAVIGPDNKIYIADGHHRVATYLQLSRAQHHTYTLYLKVIKKFSSQTSLTAFWQWMQTHNASYLKDRGKQRPAAELPKSVDELTNDKYRSLTGWLAKQHWCFAGNKINFIEFFWANHFRKLAATGQIPDYPDFDLTRKDEKRAFDTYLKTIQKANYCYLETAKQIPGYCASATDCLKQNRLEDAAVAKP